MVRSRYLYHRNPLKTRELSYRMVVSLRKDDTIQMTHGLFENGVFYSGQCITHDAGKWSPVVWEGINQPK